MRKYLLASAAVLGAASWLPQAHAQTLPSNPVTGTVVEVPKSWSHGAVPTLPSASPPAGANNNNNTAVVPGPGAVANPTPGTVVIHINGRVTTGLYATWSSLDKGTFPAVTGVGGATLTPAGSYKVQPTNLATYARLYTGMDGMAANGLRYGGAIEVRENFTGQSTSTVSTGASGYSSSQTLYVRRAFAYVAADNVGLVRVGQADGLISLYDNGVTTFQFLPSGNLNGGDLEGMVMGNATIPYAFSAVAGNEYDNNKIVYMSPQFYGFDVGLQWAPNTSNGYGTGVGNAYGVVAGCPYASSGCPGLSSSSVAADGARTINQTAVGVRYQGKFSGVGLLAYGVYEFSGKVNYTGPVTPSTILYNSLNFYNAGVAVTYAGFTIGGNYAGGAANGQLAPKPAGGANLNAWTAGMTYKTGPLLVGVVGEVIDSQGAVTLAGKTQRREYAIDAGASYVIAPGLVGWAEYMYQNRKQSGFNFATGAAGSSAYNTVQSQGIQIGTTVYW
ncbi:MAG: porin [Rhodospirillales bacterium]|nr:porin [Rhodospirillales bacterium]